MNPPLLVSWKNGVQRKTPPRCLAAKKKRKRRSAERKVHVHPILTSRMYTGVHHTLFPDLCADEKKFFNYFRMSKPSFEELLSYVRKDITGTTKKIEIMYFTRRETDRHWAWEAGQWAAVADTGGVVWKLPFKTMLYSEWRTLPMSATSCGSETPKR